VGQSGGTLYFIIEPSILGSLHSFFFFLSDGPIELAHWREKKKKKKKKPWEATHIIK
jgi:hypothetical protein